MVERNVLGLNLLSFLADTTGVMIGPLLKSCECRRQIPYDEGIINAHEGREKRHMCGQKLGFRPTKIMISPLGIESQPYPHREGMYLYMMDLPVYGIAGCCNQAIALIEGF